MRRRGRTCALQILYQLDLGRELEGDSVGEPAARAAIARFWHNFETVDHDDERFAERLVLGVVGAIRQMDDALGQISQNWRVDRMDKVDRNILRLACYELLRCADIPRAASINEAVELAKRFSSGESASFINGVLDQIARDKAEPASIGMSEPAAEGRREAEVDLG